MHMTGWIAYGLIGTVSVLVSALTLFSGFGLGTLLMPAFAIFFPVTIAVAATAVVHLANNLFKTALLWKHADREVVGRFALPAILTALAGAWLLGYLSDLPAVASYSIGTHRCELTVVKLVLGVLVGIFAVFDLVPSLDGRLVFKKQHFIIGAALSGFFGGLSGHQGALRSAILLRFGLKKEAFIGTGVVCAVIVDISRLAIYGSSFFQTEFDELVQAGGLGLVGLASIAAFGGAFAGTRLIGKITMTVVRRVVGTMLILLAAGLISGII